MTATSLAVGLGNSQEEIEPRLGRQYAQGRHGILRCAEEHDPDRL